MIAKERESPIIGTTYPTTVVDVPTNPKEHYVLRVSEGTAKGFVIFTDLPPQTQVGSSVSVVLEQLTRSGRAGFGRVA